MSACVSGCLGLGVGVTVFVWGCVWEGKCVWGSVRFGEIMCLGQMVGGFGTVLVGGTGGEVVCGERGVVVVGSVGGGEC